MTITRRDALLAGAAAATVAATPAAGAVGSQKRSGFLWGVATAAHQIEGNNTNSDYWVLEHIPATYFREPSGDACDSFNRWREDLALIRLAGLNSYRFSVEWARIEPERGHFSQAMLDHYRTICIACREMGIEPVVTFQHFTAPRWIAALGGWENLETADHFARYCTVVAKAIGDVIGWACTINEPNGQVTGYVIADGKKWEQQPTVIAQAAKAVGSDRFNAYFLGDAYKVRDVCIAAHAKGRDAIKAVAPHVKVGMTLALEDLVEGPDGAVFYKRLWDNARTPFYDAAKRDDFVGVQTYNRVVTGPKGYVGGRTFAMGDMWGRDVAVDALANVVREAHRATGVPVLVTENGIMETDDAKRIVYLRASVANLAAEIERGIPVLGYIHWSLLDNFEWSSGYNPKAALVAVDRTTFKRTPKPSLAAYRQLVTTTRRAHPWA